MNEDDTYNALTLSSEQQQIYTTLKKQLDISSSRLLVLVRSTSKQREGTYIFTNAKTIDEHCNSMSTWGKQINWSIIDEQG